MTTTDLVAAVLANPDALWTVLDRVETGAVRIAGPWQRRAKGSWRASADIDCVYGEHEVWTVGTTEWKRATTTLPARWIASATFTRPNTNPWRHISHPGLPSQAEAEAWVDEQLRGDGVLLVSDGCEP